MGGLFTGVEVLQRLKIIFVARIFSKVSTKCTSEPDQVHNMGCCTQ